MNAIKTPTTEIDGPEITLILRALAVFGKVGQTGNLAFDQFTQKRVLELSKRLEEVVDPFLSEL